MSAPQGQPGDPGRHPADPRDTIRPSVHPDAFVAPGAIVVGDVTIGALGSIWFGCVLRGDLEPIVVGDETNVQDLTVVHVDRGLPARIGHRVTIGHRAVIHGCVVEDDVLVGMGAILLSGCRIGRGSLVAAGAIVREGFEVPPEAIVAGVPGVIRGRVDAAAARRIRDGARSYVELSAAYRAARFGGAAR